MSTSGKILVSGLILYTAASAFLYFLQERLIFLRQSVSAERVKYIRQNFPLAEEVNVKSPDGTDLHGWLMHGSNPGKSPLIIYFGGNAEEVSWMAEYKEKIREWSLLLINYRGYGMSGGKPGEKALLADALLLYDRFSRRDDIDAGNIVMLGRSLGTAVAIHVSAHRSVAGTILASPYASIEDIARISFPVFPVRYLLRHKFNMLKLASSIENPMLTLIASDDTIVPVKHSRKLYDAWKGKKEIRVIPLSDHNNMPFSELYWQNIFDFLDRLNKK